MNHEVSVEIYDQIVEITINRPPANAINPSVSRAIHQALSTLQNDDNLRVGIITGSGDYIFSAGWDLKEIAAFDNNQDAVNSAFESPGGFAGITEFWGLKKPVISAINGLAVGGGFEIALATDMIVAADHVEFFLPVLGLIGIETGLCLPDRVHELPTIKDGLREIEFVRLPGVLASGNDTTVHRNDA